MLALGRPVLGTDLWKSFWFHTFCETRNLFSPLVLHRLAVGFSYRSLVYTDQASIFNLGANSVTEDPYTLTLSLKISPESNSKFVLPATPSVQQRNFSPSPFQCFFSLSVPEDAHFLLDFTYLKAACLGFPFTVIAELLPRRMQGSTFSSSYEFLGVWSFLDELFLHILSSCSLLRFFCCSSAMISHCSQARLQ